MDHSCPRPLIKKAIPSNQCELFNQVEPSKKSWIFIDFSYNLDVNGLSLKPKKRLFELGLTLLYYLEHGWKHVKVKTKSKYHIKILGVFE
jgi:hypothetical protein